MLTSILRTVVPALWAAIIGKVLILVPVLEPLREDLLAYGDWISAFLGVVIIAAWYAFWRWLEPRLPDWLTRLVLGSSQRPIYAKDAIVGVTDPTITEWHQAVNSDRQAIYPEDGK